MEVTYTGSTCTTYMRGSIGRTLGEVGILSGSCLKLVFEVGKKSVILNCIENQE